MISAKVINDLDGDSGYYLVTIEYSATNSFGGRNDKTSFQTITRKFENPWLAIGLLTGKLNAVLDCESFLEFYLLHENEPTNLNTEKILYYIDEAFSE